MSQNGPQGENNSEIVFENIVTKDNVEIREGVHFIIRVDSDPVGPALELSLCAWHPESSNYQVYTLECTLGLVDVYPERRQEVGRYLLGEGEYDVSLFTPQAIARVIMESGELYMESAGFELHVYLKLGTYDEMIAVEREEALQFVRFQDHRR